VTPRCAGGRHSRPIGVEITLAHQIDAAVDVVDRERAIADLAGRQHGVVARAQLVDLGLGRGAITRRLERGRLHRVHREVYAVGHRVLSRRGRWTAAVLAAGPGAVLSHRSAAALWGLRPFGPRRPEVTAVPRRRAGPGVEVHHTRLSYDEVTEQEGIAVTTASRTLLDLAAVLPRRQLERALQEAEVRRLGDLVSLERLLARHPRRRGTATLRCVIASGRAGENATRSDLEESFLALLERVGLARPEVNAPVEIAGRLIECDCVWRPQRLMVELDGHAAHGRRSAFEADRARDRALQAAGWRVVRVTWRQLHAEPATVTADMRELLRSPSFGL